MSEDVVPLERVKKSFEMANYTVKSFNDATEFLKKVDLRKSPVDRCIAWLIRLGALPRYYNLWPQTLYHTIRSDRSKLDYFLRGSKDAIPTALDEKDRKQIISDVERASPIFRKIAKDLDIEDSLISDVDRITGVSHDTFVFRVVRVICFMISGSPQFHYLQGYERFTFVSYALALKFAVSVGLSFIEAEAISGVILRRIIQIVDFSSLLQMDTFMFQHFADLDAYLKRYNPKFISCLSRSNMSSVDFASNWAFVLFADNHDPLDLLLIWDYIILYREQYNVFFNALVSAHLMQVEYFDEPGQLISSIQCKKKWDIYKLLNDAVEQLNEPFLTPQSITGIDRWWL